MPSPISGFWRSSRSPLALQLRLALPDTEDARRGYTKSDRTCSGIAAARLNRGILSYKNGRYAEAVADFDRASQPAPIARLSGRFLFNSRPGQLGLRDRRSAHVNAAKAPRAGMSRSGHALDELR